MYFLKNELFCVLLFESSADCVCAGRCIAGSYVDGFCRAGGAAVVVNAVGYVANNAVVALAGVLFIFMIHHFQKLLSVSSFYSLPVLGDFIHAGVLV